MHDKSPQERPKCTIGYTWYISTAKYPKESFRLCGMPLKFLKLLSKPVVLVVRRLAVGTDGAKVKAFESRFSAYAVNGLVKMFRGFRHHCPATSRERVGWKNRERV
jgi:hypothetical protein